MDAPYISIIIPVYNVSAYLHKCVDSVLNQTLKNIEIILVNDCSPDLLDDEICTKYALHDERIKYIKHQNNLGLGGARNSGLEVAQGKYIWFIDSDDFIDSRAIALVKNKFFETIELPRSQNIPVLNIFSFKTSS